MLIATGGDVALIILAAFWALLVGFLCYVLVATVSVLQSTKVLVDTMREETVPLLREVKTSVERTNRELDRVDGMLESAGAVMGKVEKISGLVEQAVASPLVKVLSVGAGLRMAASRVAGGKGKQAKT
ncbi:MAG: DUF948 domain-containing protein [Actinomycetota bacterium]